MPDLQAILIYFAPELILAAGALIVLAYDLVVRGRDAAQPWLAALTLLAAVGATLWLYTVPPVASAAVNVTDAGGAVVAACGQYGIFEVRGAGGDVVGCGTFVSDVFTNFFRVMAALTALLVLLSGHTFMRRRTPFRGEFYAVLLFATLAMDLMAGANDLILIALSIEFLSLSSYILTGYLRRDPLSNEGGLKYFLYGSVAGAVMLFGLSLLYGLTATTSLPGVAAVLSNPERVLVSDAAGLALPALLLVLVGMGFKIALVPFHQWSPDAYQGAPTPVTSFLSVGPKLAGFAILARLLLVAFPAPAYTVHWLSALAVLAVMTMIYGNVVALSQSNVKRMMAYSSIAQAGYMAIALVAVGAATAGSASTDALASLLVFLMAYLFSNLGAFAVIIAVDDATGSSDLASYDGLMHRSPLLGAALAVFFLSLVGIPPLAGFIGKFTVFSAAVGTGQIGLALVGVTTGVISVGYYFRVMRHAFFGAPPGTGPIRVAPTLRLVVVLALVMVFVIGAYAGPFIDLARQAAAAVAPLGAAATAGLGGG